MSVRSSLLAAALALLAGCFVSTNDTQVSGGGVGGGAVGGNGGRRTTGANGSGSGNGTSSGGGAGASGTTSGGASTGGPGGGNSTGSADAGCQVDTGTSEISFDCTGIAPFYTNGNAGNCTGNWFGTAVTNYADCQPVCNMNVSLLGTNGLTLAGYSTHSDPVTGFVHMCLGDGGITYTPQASGAVNGDSFATFVYGEVQNTLSFDIPSLGVFDEQTLQTLQDFIPGGLNADDGNAIFFIFAMSGDQCSTNAAATGWSISLDYEDGGALPASDYTVIYVDSSGLPAPGGTATSSYGVALVANISVQGGTQWIVPVYTNPDAGSCAVQNEAIGFTGRLLVGPGIFSEQGIFLP